MQLQSLASETARRLLGVALALGVAGQVLFYGVPPGLNFPVWVALVLFVGWLCRAEGARLDRLDAWLIPSAILFAIPVALRSDLLLVAFDVLAATVLTGASLVAISGIPVTRRSAATITLLGTWFCAAVLIGVAALAPHATRREPPPTTERSRRTEAVLPVVRGAVIAVPLVLVFVALFASADAVFAKGAASVLNLSIDLGDWPVRALVALVIAWICAGFLALVARFVAPPTLERRQRERPPSTTAETSPLFDGVVRWIGTTEAVVVLVALDVLFAVFVALQVAYLFGGRDTLAASGMTYSEYARRGFFELIAVVVLVGCVLVALETAAPRRTRAYLGGVVVLIVLSGVVLGSAFLRLRLYQDAYGWTELRFYALAAIAWLALSLVIGALTFLAARTRWLLHFVGVAALGVALAVNVLDPPAFVAQENIARALDPSRVAPGGRTGLDEEYAATLGYDAVPVLARALPSLPAEDRTVLERRLDRFRSRLRDQPGVGTWQAWNLARERARTALGVTATAE